jgi:sialate O-acetylesterase
MLHYPRIKQDSRWLAMLCGLMISSAYAADGGLLNTLFQDHAVVQREQTSPVWGRAQPNQQLTIVFAGRTLNARADAQGNWQAMLPALPAGGPYTLTVSTPDGATQTTRDILVGDVWLCSGQSNMELQVNRTLDWRSEVSGANNDRIRLLTVPQVSSPAPQSAFGSAVEWKLTNPQNVPEFSAACYYFARELQKTVNVPMGLINASWGGSRIEPWLSAPTLRATGGEDGSLDALARYATDQVAAGAAWAEVWTKWWRTLPGTDNGEPWNPAVVSAGWRDAPSPLIGYNQWGVPELATFTGMTWYRTTVKLSAQQAAQEATLSLGNVDEIDQTWVNGVGVGSGGRSYALPRGRLHAGDNLIVVNVLNTYKEGGIYGPAANRVLRFADGSTVPLDTDGWQYRLVPASAGTPPLAPWLSTTGKTTLFNGMIAPLGSYGLRGALWYQGESNTSSNDAARYRRLLTAYREDLRAHFGAKLALLIVQLSNYGSAPTKPAESGWADVRDAQRLVGTDDARSAVVVTIDIGDRTDIHPANKQELGRRLARAARHAVYGEKLPASGPQPLSAKREGAVVSVNFSDVTGRLVAYSSAHPIGFELCGNAAGSCRYADADLRDGVVLLRDNTKGSPVTRVRYCWSESPVCTLYDESGLPAGPFQLTVTQ